MRKASEEVFYADTVPVTVRKGDIGYLKASALTTARRRSRLCAHTGVEDKLHEMFIIHERNTYVRPHRHVDKAESVHVLEGAVDIVLFDAEGKITEVVQMGEYLTGEVFYYRLAESRFHTFLIKSEVLVFHEITSGPFIKEQTIFPEWAPVEADKEGQEAFIKRVSAEADAFLKAKVGS